MARDVDWSRTSGEDVVDLPHGAASGRPRNRAAAGAPSTDEEVDVDLLARDDLGPPVAYFGASTGAAAALWAATEPGDLQGCLPL